MIPIYMFQKVFHGLIINLMLARNFAENQEDKSSQNFKTTGQVQKRCSNVSASLLQNEQLGF